MNRFVVEKESLESVIRFTIDRNQDVRLCNRKVFNQWDKKTMRIKYIGNNSIAVTIFVEVRFGKDIVKSVEKVSQEVENNLTKLAKVNVKSVELMVKDVFDEEKNIKNS